MAPCKVTQSHRSTSCTLSPTLGNLTGINQPTTPLAGPDEVNISSQLSTLLTITSFSPSQSVTFEGFLDWRLLTYGDCNAFNFRSTA